MLIEIWSEHNNNQLMSSEAQLYSLYIYVYRLRISFYQVAAQFCHWQANTHTDSCSSVISGSAKK